MHIYSFEKLEVWKQAKDLCLLIYTLTIAFPDTDKFGLVSNMRRCCISIISNIAEGSCRSSKKDQWHFYTMSYSSCIELLNQTLISEQLSYISMKDNIEVR